MQCSPNDFAQLLLVVAADVIAAAQCFYNLLQRSKRSAIVSRKPGIQATRRHFWRHSEAVIGREPNGDAPDLPGRHLALLDFEQVAESARFGRVEVPFAGADFDTDCPQTLRHDCKNLCDRILLAGRHAALVDPHVANFDWAGFKLLNLPGERIAFADRLP